MPKYISKDGVWHPVTKFTRLELEAQGLETLGQSISDSSLVTETPVENEDVIEESEDEEVKEKIGRVKKRRGIKSRKARLRH